jgi:hypothetical protein
LGIGDWRRQVKVRSEEGSKYPKPRGSALWRNYVAILQRIENEYDTKILC